MSVCSEIVSYTEPETLRHGFESDYETFLWHLFSVILVLVFLSLFSFFLFCSFVLYYIFFSIFPQFITNFQCKNIQLNFACCICPRTAWDKWLRLRCPGITTTNSRQNKWLQGNPTDGYIPHRCFFFRTCCLSLNLTKSVHYHWSRMGK